MIPNQPTPLWLLLPLGVILGASAIWDYAGLVRVSGFSFPSRRAVRLLVTTWRGAGDLARVLLLVVVGVVVLAVSL